LKKVLNAFRDAVDAQRTYREVSYLLVFGGHENILGVYDFLCSRDDKHLYIISELLDSDLQKALQCQALQDVHKPLIAYQLLRALKYLHSAAVMHRDIKPSNVLLDKNCRVALADFGWARCATAHDQDFRGGTLMTEYPATRWYRAPELLLGARRYGTSVDIWAFACVVAEMHAEMPLFPGTSQVAMLSYLLDVLGKTLPADLEAMDAPYARFSLECLPPMTPSNPVEMTFEEEGPELVDILQLALQWNPGKRITAVEALTHPYVAAFSNPDDEPSFGRKVHLTLPDSEQFSPSTYRDQIYADAVGFSRSKRLASEHHRHLLAEEQEERLNNKGGRRLRQAARPTSRPTSPDSPSHQSDIIVPHD